MRELKRFQYMKSFLEEEGWEFKGGGRSVGNFVCMSKAVAHLDIADVARSPENVDDFFFTEDEGITLVFRDDNLFNKYCTFLKDTKMRDEGTKIVQAWLEDTSEARGDQREGCSISS